jgi:hypothetical protein
MVSGSVRVLVWVGICAAAVHTVDEHQTLAAARSTMVVGQATNTKATERPVLRNGPRIRGSADAKRAWLGAEHRGLVVNKISNREDGSLSLDLKFRKDHVTIAIEKSGAIVASRGGKTIRVTSVASFERLQQLLAGSEATFAARLLLAEREQTSDLQAPEMALLSSMAFVAGLSGDVDALRRLATRFVEKHRGIYRQVRFRTCFDSYANEASSAWNDMQGCVDEANQDPSIFNRAYRRVACNGVWLLRSESAWVEYIGCLGPGALMAQ